MHNDFMLVGPGSDPAGAPKAKDGIDASKRIAAGNVTFISRGDRSGTHAAELRLWQAAIASYRIAGEPAVASAGVDQQRAVGKRIPP